MTLPLTHADLFTGIGGFQIALRKALHDINPNIPLSTILTNDISTDAERTYRHNFGQSYAYHDIRNMHGIKWPHTDILTAGFPCQPFSILTRVENGGDNHKSGRLYHHLLRLIDANRPRLIIFENVRGITTTDNGRQLAEIRCELAQIGYNFREIISNSSSFSPQRRIRWMLIGFEKSLDITPKLPPDPAPISRPPLSVYLDNPKSIDPLLYMEKSNWYNLLSKREFRPHAITREEAELLQTVTPTLLSGGRRGAQDIFIDEGRITPRILSTAEQRRIMGFPDNFKIGPASVAQTLFGNSIIIPHIAYLITPALIQLLDNS